MKSWSLLFTRITVGWLLVLWGLDKLVNVDHSVAVAESFYLGIGSSALVQGVLGVLEVALGAMVVLGLFRRIAYPITVAVLGITALSVWKSIVDPWGWVLADTQVLFYPSAIVLAASLVLWGFIDEDDRALDAKRGR